MNRSIYHLFNGQTIDCRAWSIRPRALSEDDGHEGCSSRLRDNSSPNPPQTTARDSVGPRFRNEELLEEADGVPIGHAGEKVARRGVESLLLDRAPIEELVGAVAHFVPEAA